MAHDMMMLTAKAARMFSSVSLGAWIRYSAMPKSRKFDASAANTVATAKTPTSAGVSTRDSTTVPTSCSAKPR